MGGRIRCKRHPLPAPASAEPSPPPPLVRLSDERTTTIRLLVTLPGRRQYPEVFLIAIRDGEAPDIRREGDPLLRADPSVTISTREREGEFITLEVDRG